jgi:RhoGEF domain
MGAACCGGDRDGHASLVVTPEHDANAEKRKQVIRDLIASEVKYINQLNRMIKYYRDPLYANPEQYDLEVIMVRDMFANVLSLSQFHEELVEDIKESVQSHDTPLEDEPEDQIVPLPRLFGVLAADLHQIYIDAFLVQYEASYRTISREHFNDRLKKFFAKQRADALADSDGKKPLLHLATYMIIVYERIKVYVKFLEALADATDTSDPRVDKFEKAQIEESLQAIKELTKPFNEKERECLSMMKLVRLQETIDTEAVTLVRAGRRVVSQDVFALSWIKPDNGPSRSVSTTSSSAAAAGADSETEKHQVFLFNDSLVWTTYRESTSDSDVDSTPTLCGMIELRDTEVKEHGDGGGDSGKPMLQLFANDVCDEFREIQLTCEFDTKQEYDTWLAALNDARTKILNADETRATRSMSGQLVYYAKHKAYGMA